MNKLHTYESLGKACYFPLISECACNGKCTRVIITRGAFDEQNSWIICLGILDVLDTAMMHVMGDYGIAGLYCYLIK